MVVDNLTYGFPNFRSIENQFINLVLFCSALILKYILDRKLGLTVDKTIVNSPTGVQEIRVLIISSHQPRDNMRCLLIRNHYNILEA